MGPEKLDNAVYFIRGLYDLADMARSKHDAATYAWTASVASNLHQRFDGTWWYDRTAQQYADSLTGPGDAQSFQKHWIGQTPMEAELTVNGQTVPGLAPFDHGNVALAGREDGGRHRPHPPARRPPRDRRARRAVRTRVPGRRDQPWDRGHRVDQRGPPHTHHHGLNPGGAEQRQTASRGR